MDPLYYLGETIRSGWLVQLWVVSAVILLALFWLMTRGVKADKRMTSPRRRATFLRRHPPAPRPSS